MQKTCIKNSLTAVVILCLFFLISLSCFLQKNRKYFEAAAEAANWIRSSGVQTEFGTAWPAVPGESNALDNGLYSGNPGVVLFFLEMFYATGDDQYLSAARAGADNLLGPLLDVKSMGLYVGLSGIGFVLYETYKASKDPKYLEGFQTCLQFLRDSAEEMGPGVEWSPITDIISGTAGTGLFLIYAHRETQEKMWLNLAELAGKRLIEKGETAEKGMKWAMSPDYPRYMPNFSHGTAGIAYFLASLYMETHKEEFLQGALAGAHYLKAVAFTEGDVCLIFHHEPEGEDLFYLGWCHGPVGTARLFYRLYQITQSREWLDWIERGAKAVLESGIPERETEGFWNNVGLCCGSAGVADFFLHLYREFQKEEYIDFVRSLTDNLLARATKSDEGMQWIQAEHRSRPEFLQAQTGLMQGAAGIGLWLLRLDAFDQKSKTRIFLPDNPFALVR